MPPLDAIIKPMGRKASRRGHKTVRQPKKAIVNRRASFDYDLGDDFIVGLELTGAETKSARLGRVNLRGAYVVPKLNRTKNRQELFLINASFSIATNAPKGSGQEATTVDNRARRVLAKRREIDQLISARSSGMTIIPTKLLTTGRYIKLVIALGKGKRNYDKRETIRRRQTERETARILEKF